METRETAGLRKTAADVDICPHEDVRQERRATKRVRRGAGGTSGDGNGGRPLVAPYRTEDARHMALTLNIPIDSGQRRLNIFV
jgi:hypothetical protein